MTSNIRIIAIAIIVIAVVGGILIALNSGDDLEGTAGGNKNTPPGQDRRETAQADPTDVPPTQAPPTQVPPTNPPPTQAPPTQAPPTQVPPTQIPPTQAPPTNVPQPTEDSQLACQRNNPDRIDCSSLAVSGVCQNVNGVATAIFTIRNTGEPGDGDMRASTQYRLIQDGTQVSTGSILLNGGTTMTVTWDQGTVVRLEADQQVGHPGNSRPNAEVTLDCGERAPTVTRVPNTPTPTEEEPTDVPPTDVPPSRTPDSRRYTICHVAGRADAPANYVILRNIPYQAFRGHFDENGTPEAGHEQDFIINSPADEARCAPPTATPTEEPEGTLTPTDTPADEPTATPTLTPTVAPECGELVYDESGFPVPYGGDCEEDEEPTPTPEPEVPYQAPPQEPATCVDWIVYHTDITGDWEIFRLGDLPAGQTGEPNLSKGVDSFDVAPSRSPDARAIAFASNRDGNWEIYMATVDGLIVQRITRNALAIDIDPVWSPTGEYIAYESNRLGNWELYLVDVETGEESRLTASPANDINPYWSPDGTKLLFQSDEEGFWQIYELDLSTEEITLVSDGEGDDHDPQYSFDGTQILFRSYRDGDNSVIYKMDADGSNITRLSDPEGDASNHVWAPQDVAVAYESNFDGDLDIYVYEFASEETRQVTDNDVADYAPTWICNSTTVVFTSDVTGNPDIFSTNALPVDEPAIVVEEDASQLTDDIANDQYPQNSPPEENASRQGALPSPSKNK